MSGTTPAPVARDPAVNAVVAQARSLPELVEGLKHVEPELAQSIEGKALVEAKTPWGVLVAAIAAWASTRYGLGWDASTCALVSGVAVLVASYAMRWITTGPIRGLLVHQPVART